MAKIPNNKYCPKCNGTGVKLYSTSIRKCVDCIGTGIQHVKRAIKLSNGRLVTALVPRSSHEN